MCGREMTLNPSWWWKRLLFETTGVDSSGIVLLDLVTFCFSHGRYPVNSSRVIPGGEPVIPWHGVSRGRIDRRGNLSTILHLGVNRYLRPPALVCQAWYYRAVVTLCSFERCTDSSHVHMPENL